MKSLWLTSVIALTSLPGFAIAQEGETEYPTSPASRFLEEVRREVSAAYYPRPSIDPEAILARAADELAERCEPHGADCPEEVGVDVATRAVARFEDPHTRIEAENRAAAPARAGPAAPSAPLGWMLRANRTDGALYAAWVAPDGPAARAGVRRHDIVSDQDNRSASRLSGWNASLKVDLSRAGRTFAVAIEPAGDQGPRPRLDWIGTIVVLQFPLGAGDGVAQEAHDLVSQAQSDGATGLILDLRDNPGGGIQCAAMAGAFLDYTVVMTDREGRGRTLSVTGQGATMVDEEETETLLLDRPARWRGPLATLVNDNTGSCAEAVAIQIGLADRGVIYGEQSVGVGNNVIQPASLPGGRRLLMTVAYGADENGRPLPARPEIDVPVEDDPHAIARTGHDPVLAAAVSALS